MPFGIVGRMGPGMRQMVGFGNRSTVRGTHRGEFGACHGPRGPNGRTCATAPRCGPLVTLGRLVIIIIIIICIFVRRTTSAYRLNVRRRRSLGG